jgi:hypothetical protein
MGMVEGIGEWWRGAGRWQEEEMVQTMYIHMNKCIKNLQK